MPHTGELKAFLIFLVAAGIIVPFFHRARIGTVLGFLLVGVALGPFGLGRLIETYPWLWYLTFDQPERAQPAAELGIIFLLFLLGLELSLERLWQLRVYVFGVGAAQVALSALAIGLIASWSGAQAPIVLGLCLALSSTAIVMQLLIEQGRSATQLGRVALSVLLFQDLMVVPILFVVGVLGRGTDSPVLSLVGAFVQALAAVGLIMLAGRYAVRPLLRSAARTGSRDLIMAITLLIVIGAAVATGAAGLSAALGAFLAGLLLNESEYRHHIEVDLEPFRGLLLGIFFITVGTSIDLRVVVAQASWILLAVAGLIVVKGAILFVAARAFGVPLAVSVELALLLAQASEFALVVIGLARGHDLLSPQIASSALAVVGLSMMATPLLAQLAGSVARRLERLEHRDHAPGADGAEFQDHVVIGGFGRVGQTIGRLLAAENIRFVALDANAQLVAEHRAQGRQVYFGDASRRELLERAGARNARAFVVTLDAPAAAERMVEAVRALRPDAAVFARARDPAHAANLAARGALDVIPEAVEASLQLGARVLEALGLPEEAVAQRIEEARDDEVGRFEHRSE